MAERLTKQQLKHDRFIEAVFAAWGWVQDNMAIAVAALAGLVAVIVLAVKLGASSAGVSGGNPEAEQALAAARSQFALGQDAQGVSALEQVRSAHRGSAPAKEAAYLLGNALFEQGEYARAQSAFEDFLNKPVFSDLLQDGARLGVAACKEELGDLAGAAADYELVWSAASQPASRIQAGMSAARVYRAQGQPDKAHAIYTEIVETYPTAPEATQARFERLSIDQSS